MKYPLILILLCNFHISEITCSLNDPVCANSFDSNNRNHEIIKCILPQYDVELNLECKVQLNYDVSEFEIYDAIKVALRLLYKSSSLTNVINETVFKWDALGEHKSDKSISHHSNFDLNTKLENNITVNMTFVNRTMESLANLVLYNIYEVCELFKPKLKMKFVDFNKNNPFKEKMYRICPFFELLEDNSVCCEVEIKKEEETLLEMNFYMCLVLVGLLVLVFAVIAMVSCICPSDQYKSVDEMLTKMPNEQVKALKQIVRNERNSMVQEEVRFIFTGSIIYSVILNIFKTNN